MALEGIQEIYRGYFPVYLIKPWVNHLYPRNNGQTTVYTTQQGVQGAVSVVLALWLWVLLMYYRQNLSSYGFLGYKASYYYNQ